MRRAEKRCFVSTPLAEAPLTTPLAPCPGVFTPCTVPCICLRTSRASLKCLLLAPAGLPVLGLALQAAQTRQGCTWSAV